MFRLVRFEERVVLDGAGFVEATEQAIEHTAEQWLDSAQQSLEFLGDTVALAPDVINTDSARKTLNVIAVSSAVVDADQIVAAASNGSVILHYNAEIDSAADVLQKIRTIALSNGQQIDSLAIVSHGKPGSFNLGNEAIDATSLTENSPLWQQLGSVLTTDAELQLYACDTGAGAQGSAIVQQLATATSADVFASSNITGKNSDWHLEVASNNESALALLDAIALTDYGQQLTVTVDPSATLSAMVDEGSFVVINEDSLSYDDNLGDRSDLRYTITSGPSLGEIVARNPATNTFTATTQFTQQQVDDGDIRYQHRGMEPTPPNDQDSFNFTVRSSVTSGNNANDQTTGTFTISDIQPVNDAPELDLNASDPTGFGRVTTFTEGGGAVFLGDVGDIELSDEDSQRISQITGSFSRGFTAGEDVIEFDTSVASEVTGSYNATNGTLTLTGTGGGNNTATLADFQAVLNTLQYNNTAEEPNEAFRRIDLRAIDDVGAVGNLSQVVILIDLVNDAPTINQPADVTVAEDEGFIFPAGTFTVADNDAGTSELVLDLAVSNGQLTINDLAGAMISGGSNGSAAVQLTGTINQLNSAIDQLSYRGNLNYNGPDSLRISINDQGNTGTSAGNPNVAQQPAGNDAPITTVASVAINVTLVNDAPVADDDLGATNEDSLLTVAFNASNADGINNGLLINDTDVDLADTLVVQSINAVGSAATVAVGAPLQLTRVDADGATVNAGTVTVNANGSYSFDPRGDYDYLSQGQTTTALFEYTINDGNGITDTALVTITITGVNENVSGPDGTDAVDDLGAIDEDNLLTVAFDATNANGINNGLLINDTDVDLNDTLTVESINAVGSATTIAVGSPLQLTRVDADGATVNAGTVTVAADGSYSFDPRGDYDYLSQGETTTALFEYTINDGQGITDTALVTITITGVNENVSGPDGTDAIDDLGATNEDSLLTVAFNASNADGINNGLLINDTDVDLADTLVVQSINAVGSAATVAVGAPLQLTRVDADGATVNAGTVTVNANGSYSFDPRGDYDYLSQGQTTTALFEYTINDGNGITDTALVTITITGVNENVSGPDGTDAVDDLGAIDEDNLLTVAFDATNANGINNGLLINDTDVDLNDTLTVESINAVGSATTVAVGSPLQLTRVDADGATVNAGTVTVAADGSYSFDPRGDYDYLSQGETTTALFEYTINDGQGITDTALVTITITGVNENVSGPDGTDAIDDLGATNEDSLLTVAFNASNADGINNGLLINDTDVDLADTLVVQSINAVGSAATVAVGAPLQLTRVDADGATVNAGTVTVNANGSYSFDPRGDYDYLSQGQTTTALFEYTINDGNGITDTALVTITITGVNDSPIPTPTNVITPEDTTVNVPLGGTDVDGTVDFVTVTKLPTNGQLLFADGTAVVANQPITPAMAAGIQFVPATNFNGEVTLCFTVTDNDGATSDPTEITVTVTPVNDAPVATDNDVTTNEDTTVEIPLGGTDVDGTVDFVTVTKLPTNGQLLFADGTAVVANQPITPAMAAGIQFVPATNFNGEVTLCFTVTDNDGATSDPTEITVTVTPVNDAPVATDNDVTTNEDTTVEIPLGGTDVDGTVDFVTVTKLPTNGQLLFADGTTVVANQPITPAMAAGIQFVPATNFNGEVTLCFTVTDNDGATSDPTEITVTVTPVNDPPVASSDPLDAVLAQSVHIIGGTGGQPDLIQFSDVDHVRDELTLRIITIPENGLLVINRPGQPAQTLTAGSEVSGADLASAEISFTYFGEANDGVFPDDSFLFEVSDPLQATSPVQNFIISPPIVRLPEGIDGEDFTPLLSFTPIAGEPPVLPPAINTVPPDIGFISSGSELINSAFDTLDSSLDDLRRELAFMQQAENYNNNQPPVAPDDITQACSLFEVLDLECRINDTDDPNSKLATAQPELTGRYMNDGAASASESLEAMLGLLNESVIQDENSLLKTAQASLLGRYMNDGANQASTAPPAEGDTNVEDRLGNAQSSLIGRYMNDGSAEPSSPRQP